MIETLDIDFGFNLYDTIDNFRGGNYEVPFSQIKQYTNDVMKVDVTEYTKSKRVVVDARVSLDYIDEIEKIFLERCDGAREFFREMGYNDFYEGVDYYDFSTLFNEVFDPDYVGLRRGNRKVAVEFIEAQMKVYGDMDKCVSLLCEKFPEYKVKVRKEALDFLVHVLDGYGLTQEEIEQVASKVQPKK